MHRAVECLPRWKLLLSCCRREIGGGGAGCRWLAAVHVSFACTWRIFFWRGGVGGCCMKLLQHRISTCLKAEQHQAIV